MIILLSRGRTPCIRLLLILFGTALCLAQSYKGAIHVQTSFPGGKIGPGVSVTLEGETLQRKFATDKFGRVHFRGLVPGIYQITCQMVGFRTIVRPKVRVNASVTTKLALKMLVSGQTHQPILPLYDPIDAGPSSTTIIDGTELQFLPQSRDPNGILETIPGIQTDRVSIAGNNADQFAIFASHGDDGSNTVWAIDGIEMSDPTNEGQALSTLDFGTLNQIAVTTGGADVSNATSGTIVNFITKQGGNQHRANLSLLYADKDFQSNNTPDGLNPSGLTEYFERGIEIGGPIVKDRFWYWGAFQQTTLEAQSIAASQNQSELEHIHFKLHSQITPTTRASAFYMESHRERTTPATFSHSPESQPKSTGNVPLLKVDVNQLIGQNTEIQFSYSRVDSDLSISPQVSPNVSQPVFNQNLGRWENSYRDLSFSKPTRQYDLRGDTYLSTSWGGHELSYGFQYKEAWSIRQEHWGNQGSNLWVDDSSGLNHVSYFHAHRDWTSGTELDSTSVWLKDRLSIGNLILDLGLRFNQSESHNMERPIAANPLFPEAVPATVGRGFDEPVDYETVSPHIGASYEFGSDKQFLVRGSYRKYFDPISTNEASISNRAGRAWITGYAQDYDGNGQYDASELGFALDGDGNVIPYRGNEATQDPYFIRSIGIDNNNPVFFGPGNRTDPNLKPPEVDEFLFGGQWTASHGLSIAATLTHRKRSNTHWTRTILDNGTFFDREDYEIAHTLTGTHPENGRLWEVNYYVFSAEADDLRRELGANYLTNRPDYEEEFNSLQLNATKRLANRWMFRGHLHFQDWTRNVGPDGILNPTPDTTRSNVDGTDVAIASTGSGSTGDVFPGTASWSAGLHGLYQLPWHFTFAGSLTAREGYQMPLFVTARGFRNGADRADNRNFSIDSGESIRYEDLINFNLKLSKNMDLGLAEIVLALEVFNVFNESTVLQRNRNYGSHLNNRNLVQNFDDPGVGTVRSTYTRVDEYIAPRTARFSAVIRF